MLEADGGEDKRLGVTSVFHGPSPELRTFPSEDEEAHAAGRWLAARASEGVPGDTMAVLVRSPAQLDRGRLAIAASGVVGVESRLMHDAKGSEFRAVAALACDADALPDEARLLAAADERDLREVYDTERHLLYVAATRAREHLWLSAVSPTSEFLDDLLEASGTAQAEAREATS